jgi:hypothetical protein
MEMTLIENLIALSLLSGHPDSHRAYTPAWQRKAKIHAVRQDAQRQADSHQKSA